MRWNATFTTNKTRNERKACRGEMGQFDGNLDSGISSSRGELGDASPSNSFGATRGGRRAGG